MGNKKINIDDIPDEHKHGNCFVVALQYVMKHPDTTLVHGIVTGQGAIAGLEYNHAWVEDNGMVIDNTVNLTLPKEIYYKIGRIKITRRYSYNETIENMVKYETYGPWDKKLLQYP